MFPASPSRILLCAPTTDSLAETQQVLCEQGHKVTFALLGTPDPAGLANFQLVIVDGSHEVSHALAFCRHVKPRLEENVIPLLFLLDDPTPAARLTCLQAGADAYLLRPYLPRELITQTLLLLRGKETSDRLAERVTEINRISKRLQQAYRQIDEGLELAQRLQARFRPHPLPQVPHARFAVHSRTQGGVGGEFYDLYRLDENHVGLYLGDAMGQGVAACLLSTFVDKSIRSREILVANHPLVRPDEVLGRLNHELIEQRLSEQPFLTLIYALFDPHTGNIQIARAGHPCPLFVPGEGDIGLWKQDGLLLGVMDARFPLRSQSLAPGDKLLFYTDGVENVRFADHPAGLESLLACAQQYRRLSVENFVARLSHDLVSPSDQPEDFTLLGIERLA